MHKQTFRIQKISSLSSCRASEREWVRGREKLLRLLANINLYVFDYVWILHLVYTLLQAWKSNCNWKFVVVEQPCNKSCMICVQFWRHKFWLPPVFLEIHVNICAGKTFQLSWLIIKLFSLSLASSHCEFKRHIAPLIYNNNIDFNLKGFLVRSCECVSLFLKKTWSLLAFQRKNLFCSLLKWSTSLGPLTQWIVIFIQTNSNCSLFNLDLTRQSTSVNENKKSGAWFKNSWTSSNGSFISTTKQQRNSLLSHLLTSWTCWRKVKPI